MSFSLHQTQKCSFIEGIIKCFTHTETGFQVLHLHNTDKENVFMFAIPTYPKDNTGVTHILEHSVLSGSAHYQVKSPFFLLEQGSCRTYLNAATYPDRTLFMGSSLLQDDLFNLLSMCGDAVWYPLLEESVFRREGFYLKFNNDTTERGGVVYNEMKGVYSDKLTLMENEVHTRLFSEVEYKYDMGGNPDDIPFLTYKDFLTYHAQYYRPEHTKIILYGNIETEDYLDFIEKKLLTRWNSHRQETPAVIPLQPHKNLIQRDEQNQETIHIIDVPTSTHTSGEEGTLDIVWLLGDSSNTVETGLLRFVHFVLLGIPGSPLRKKIIESGLVEDISPLAGHNTSLRQSTYDIGITGARPSDYRELVDLVFAELERIAQEGIKEEIKEAALSSIEFSFKERLNNTSGKIGWLSKISCQWLYGHDPFKYMDVYAILEEVKTALAVPRALENFIRRNFLENSHRVIVGTRPDLNYEQNQVLHEQQRVSQLTETPEDLRYWKNIQQEIEKSQSQPDSPEHISKIPLLHKNNLPQKIETVPFEPMEVSEFRAPVHWLHNADNGILYVTLYFDITDIICDQYTRLLLPTLTVSMTDIGVKTLSYEDLSIQICLCTGRLRTLTTNYIHMDHSTRMFVQVRMSVLEHKRDNAFALLQKIFLESDFSNTVRLQEIINEGKAMMKSRLIDSGTSIALLKSAKNFSFNALIDDDLNGIEQLKWIQSIHNINIISDTLTQLSSQIFTQERVSVAVVGAERLQSSTLDLLHALLYALPHNGKTVENSAWLEKYIVEHDKYGAKVLPKFSSDPVARQAIILPTQISFNAMVVPAVNYAHKDYAYHNIASRVISQRFLEEIRMEYGAYGASATVLGDEGLLVCYTYRDPNIEKTYQIFRKVLEDISVGTYPITSFESHIVGAVGESLVELSPQGKSSLLMTRIYTGITDEMRQNIRDAYLDAIPHDIQKIVAGYVENLSDACIATVSSEDKIRATQWDNVEYAPH